MTLDYYPAIFTPLVYEDKTVTWTVTIINPCLTTALTAFGSYASFVTMSTSVLGATQYQSFTDLQDSISLAYDSLQGLTTNVYTVPAPYSSGSTPDLDNNEIPTFAGY